MMNYNKLKGIVHAKGTTLQKMSQGIGVNQSTLIRQCHSGKMPILTVKKIIEFLNLNRDEINYVFFEN